MALKCKHLLTGSLHQAPDSRLILVPANDGDVVLYLEPGGFTPVGSHELAEHFGPSSPPTPAQGETQCQPSDGQTH